MTTPTTIHAMTTPVSPRTAESFRAVTAGLQALQTAEEARAKNDRLITQVMLEMKKNADAMAQTIVTLKKETVDLQAQLAQSEANRAKESQKFEQLFKTVQGDLTQIRKEAENNRVDLQNKLDAISVTAQTAFDRVNNHSHWYRWPNNPNNYATHGVL